MMYQIKRADKKFFSRKFLKIFIISLLIVIFVFSISNPLNFLIPNNFSPLFKTGNYFYSKLNEIPKFFSDKNKLVTENIKLSSEIEDLNIKLTDYQSLKYENQKLREELKIKPIGNFISASVIAKPPQIPLDSLFLDKGLKDGINKGDLVLVGKRILIGKIIRVSKNKATVSLNSFAKAISYGFVTRTNEPLKIKGAGGDSLEAKTPIDFDIVVGDKIMVANSSNYLIAVVRVIEKDISSGFKNILMSSPADISKINIVFIKSQTNE